MELTKQILSDRYGEQLLIDLSDKANHAAINDDVINAAIADAGEIAQSYYNAAGLGAYTFDAATVAKMADIAIYRLASDNVTDLQQTRYDQAIKWFDWLVTHPTAISDEQNADDSEPITSAFGSIIAKRS